MKALFSLFFISLIITPLLPLASAHGVCTGIPPRFGRLDDVHFSSQSVQTGDTITITGNITSLIQQSLQGYFSIHSNPSPHGRWQVVSTEPNEQTANITQFSRIPFSITVKALQPGTYKISPMLYLPEIGPAFSMLNGCNTEPVVTVTGNSICNQGFVGIMKAEDNSPVCVKPDTVNILVERGWAKEIVSANHPTTTQMELKAYGFVCCGLYGDLLKGYLTTSTSFVSNATVQISINGIVMGYAKTYPDGCFQFNQWNESKLAEQTDAFLANEKKYGVYKPFNLTFTAHFAGDKNHDPMTAQTTSAMSLTAIPFPPPQLETTLIPPQVNLTQGSSSNFQVSVRPMVEQWNIPHLNLYLEGYPCETYFRLSQSSDNNTASTTHPALFDGTMSASTDSPEGKYFVHMMQNGTNRFVANDIGTFTLNVMKMK